MTLQRNGLEVTVITFASGKQWMIVKTPPEGAPPSFEDWFVMIRVLCDVEIRKYGGDPANPDQWERWTDLPREFFLACFQYDATYAQLRSRFGLPR